MVGKNNNYVRESKSNEHFQRFALRKLSVGVVSVAVAAGFYLGSGATAQAATTESNASAKTEQVVQQDSTSTSNSSAAVSTSSATPVSTESASSMTVSDLPASASAASDNQASAANASESSSQSASSSVASDAAATVSKDSQAASEANSQSAADVETVQLLTLAANANANESQAANILGAQAVQKAANQQAPAGFTVTDPNYPAEMYKDPDASHYTYWWAQSSNGEYNLVLSTDRNGDGKVYVFLLGNNNNVLGKYTVDKNKSTEVATDDEGDFGTVYNDGQSGVFVTSDGTWKSKFNVFDPKAGEDNGDYGSISFMIPQVETQTTTYVDGKGNTVSDPVVQKGLDGQIYTTQGGKVINGYFAKEPSNANGFMSPFGKKNVTYTKDWHNGTKAEFTEIDTATGLMHVKVFEQGWFGRWETVDEFDLAYGKSEKVETDYGDITIHSIYIPQTINIQYTYEKLGNLVISSDSNEDKTTTQYPNDESDSTKAGNVTIPKVAGFTPTIDGKTVTNYTFNPSDYVSDLSKDINVVYVADTQEAAINFCDETDNKQLDDQTIQLTGKTGEKISHTEADQTLAKLEKLGYVVDQNTFADDATYDNDTQAPQEFTIYLKHGTTHTDATSSKADQKTVNETIHYVYKDGVNANKPAAADYNTTVDFKRGYTTDNVTGKIVSYDDWTQTTKTFGAVKSPVIAGYTADQAEVAAQTVKPDSQNIVKTVYYTADTQEAAINFFDETNGKLLDNETIHLTGKTGEKISHTEADQTLADLVKQGYVVDQNTFADDATYDNDTQAPQEFTIYLKHGTTHTDATSSKADQKTVSETIHYVYKDGVNANKPAAADYNTTVDFKRGYTTDNVTGKIVSYDDWTQTTKTFGAVKSPVIAGYTADQAEVAAQTVKPDSQNIVKTVYYTADTQEAAINFFDETNGKLLDNETIHLTGKTGEKISHTEADQTLADLVKQGYVVDQNTFADDATYDNDTQAPQEFTIYLKHGTTHTDATSSKADQKTVSETIHYVYKDGVNANKPAAADYNTTVDFKRGYTTDNVTGKIVSYDDWTQTTKTFGAVKSPVIAGYTADQAEVAAQTVKPDSQNIVKTVYYTADTQEAAINFFDETNGKLLDNETIHLTGKTGEKISHTEADQTLADLVKQGYVVDQNTFADDATYDNDTQAPQEFTIYLKHGTTHTDATSSKADQKTVSETIHYVYKDGVNANKPAAADYNTTVDFKRGYTTDNVTGKIVSYDDWTQTTKTFGAVKSPVIAGYTADQAEVAAQTVTPDSQNIVKTVYYTADTQEAAINFYDETDNKQLDNQTIHLTGKTGEKVDRTQAEKTLAELEKQGYVLDKENTAKAFPADATYDNDDVAPQEFTIYLKHGMTHTDATDKNAEQKIVTETIHYVYENNQTAKPDYTSAVDFKRGYTTDNVTGKVVSYDPWTVSSKKFGVVKSPIIEGYTPNYSQIDEITVTPDSKDVVKTVVYVGNAQEAQAIFYDETTGKEISGTREIATGKSDEAINFTKDPSEIVRELEAKGYVFDKSNANNKVFVDGSTYDKNSEVHQYFKYYFTHGHATVTPDQDPQKGQKTVTQTIKYEYADGTATGLADNVQTLTFKRTGDKDLVTHEVTWPDWSTVAGQQTSVVTSPALKGYTADTNEIPAITYHAGDSDVTYVVKYNADVQHAVINYIDGESDEILHTDKVNGHSDEKINYSTADMIKQLEAKGYELFKDNFPAGEKFDNDDKNDQTYTVIFKHHRENVDPNHSSADGTKGTKTLTETVHYKYANGTKAAEDQTAQVTFTRNGVLDDVTGIVAWGKWNEASQSYKALTSPTIAGYTPSEAVVKRSSNSDAEQGPTLTVIYTADAQKVHVQYIDGETDQMLRQDDLDGYTDETIPYSTAEGIKKFEGDGYELFKDNFPAGEKFDNDDNNDQFYTVIFKHHRENVDPNHSSADGTKGTKTLTETVHYKYANGTKAAEDQTAQVTFTRNGVLDDVTGIVAWGKWNEASQSYKALTSPTIAGYTPSEAVVKRSSNSDAEQGPTLTVIYTADAQKVHVQYIDGETDQMLRQDDLDGYTDETIPYSTAEGIKKFEGDGYELFKDNFPAGEKFDNDDTNDQFYTVIFKHHRENVDPNHSSADGTKGTKTLTETVHYKYADGTKAAEDQTAQVTFTRNGVLDDVTGIVAWGKWNEASQSYKALTSPTIAGYTPSEAVVKRSSNSDAEQGPTLTVIYTADAQTAYVKYVDDTTGETLRQDDLHGYTDETIPYSTAEGIKKYEGDGYVLVSDGFKPGTKFGVGTPTYEVHFKHGTTHTDATDENADQKTVTETIHYVDENNQTVQPDSTTAVTFKRGYTTDNVTGKVVSYDPWTVDGNQADSKTFAAVPSPAVEGYTPNHQQINEFTVTPDSKDIVKTVVYVGDPQEAQAIFYDETTGKEISNTREIVNGKTDETIGFTKDPNEVVKELEKQGYVFDKDNANNNVFAAGTTYDKNSEVHQYFKYYFTHATTIVTPDNPKTPADVLPDNPGKNYPSGVAKDDLNKTVTRTINITMPDGKTQTITQKAEFTRSATVDEVTGEVTYGPWSKNVVLESVDVPNIPGYVPSASVPEITVTPNDQDMTINITYKKLDSGKTTDQNGNASNGGSTTDQTVQNGQAGQTQNNTDVQNAQQLPQTGNANNEKSVLGLASAMFAAGLGLGFGSKKKRHED